MEIEHDNVYPFIYKTECKKVVRIGNLYLAKYRLILSKYKSALKVWYYIVYLEEGLL